MLASLIQLLKSAICPSKSGISTSCLNNDFDRSYLKAGNTFTAFGFESFRLGSLVCPECLHTTSCRILIVVLAAFAIADIAQEAEGPGG